MKVGTELNVRERLPAEASTPSPPAEASTPLPPAEASTPPD